MTLADLENAILLQLQEQNVSFGSTPSFTTGANYAQSTVDWAINRAYAQTLTDLSDISLVTQSLDFPSVSGKFAYPIPVAAAASGTLTTAVGTGVVAGIVLTYTVNGAPITYTTTSTDGALSALAALVVKVNASTLVTGNTINPMQIGLNGPSFYKTTAFAPGTAGNSITTTASSSNSAALSITASAATLTGGTAQSPSIRIVRDVYYQPLGLTYSLQRAPGVRLISFEEYQRRTVSGYFQVFSAGQQPDFVAVDTPRQNLYLYPSPYNTGDTIRLQYAPQLTNSASVSAANWGYLVNPTDALPSMLPEDVGDCIWMYACFLIWPKAREPATAKMYKDMYSGKIKEVIANYTDASEGAAFGIRDKGDLLAGSYGNL